MEMTAKIKTGYIPQEDIDKVAHAIEVAGLEMAKTPNAFLTTREKTVYLAKAAIKAIQTK